MNTLERILDKKIIVICRKVYGDDMLHLIDALYQGGLRMAEVTFDQADPACLDKTGEAIAALHRHFGEELTLGAGTVLTPEQARAACQAGAKLIISPNVDADVIRKTKELNMISIPGAMTPTEVMQAHNAGADLVKIFPAAELGLGYVKAIRAPLSHVKLLAAGGVTEDNLMDHFKAGYCAVGVSGRMCDRKAIANGDWAEMTRRAQAFAAIVEQFKQA